MPYKFKDNQNKPNQSKKFKLLFIGLSGFIILESTFEMIAAKSIDIHSLINIGLAFFVVWGVWFNGYYKIMRAYASWKLRKQDSKFDYFHT